MKHPNIIKIICHDIGRHLGCYGVKSINSNAIDTLAKNGILFKNSFATSPGCSPSRAAIATGMYPHNTGVLGLAHAHFGWSLDKKINHINYVLKPTKALDSLISNEFFNFIIRN